MKKFEFQSKSKNSRDGSSTSSSGKQLDLLKLMTHFDGRGDVSVYLELFERQIARMNVLKEKWVMYLLTHFH